METIGKRIRLLRRSQNMNQAEFAQQIGLKQGMVSLWELDKNINERTIKAICYTFGVNENWLKNGTEEPFTDSVPPKEENHLINEVEMLDIYHELLPPSQKDVLKYARNMLDLQKFRNVNPADEPPDSA
jgi:transcriptional regulator with XRE-family HTH domain